MCLRVDKDVDGQITKEVKEIITISASGNKLSKIQEHAKEYAALIMEEIDLDNLRYIKRCCSSKALTNQLT
ncbi:hypothetical protein F0562_019942 [Nyssa sinensis]|uniref:Uncharacterized protein n=1 Tax=Nyssa sinensis TaxID=561372 RepID=A0A5J5BQK7_9ASTE|nr:hypothetical protein F0562_019942 [Nyssa sinensis]